jgi:hypothetical protein
MSANCEIVDLTFRHALIGTWTHPDETAEYTISALGGVCAVSGVDTSDGEQFEIFDVSWDGQELRFTSRMPSTDYVLQHVLRVISQDEVEHEWTRIECWIKKSPTDHEAV